MKKIILLCALVLSTSAHAKIVNVNISGFAFQVEGKLLKVHVGDIVVFTNLDGSDHSVDPSATSEVQFDGSGNLKTNQTFSLPITELSPPIDVICELHPSMVGIRIVVSEPTALEVTENITASLMELEARFSEGEKTDLVEDVQNIKSNVTKLGEKIREEDGNQ